MQTTILSIEQVSEQAQAKRALRYRAAFESYYAELLPHLAVSHVAYDTAGTRATMRITFRKPCLALFSLVLKSNGATQQAEQELAPDALAEAMATHFAASEKVNVAVKSLYVIVPLVLWMMGLVGWFLVGGHPAGGPPKLTSPYLVYYLLVLLVLLAVYSFYMRRLYAANPLAYPNRTPRPKAEAILLAGQTATR